MAEITREEWLAELERVGGIGGNDGATVTELVESTGRCRRWLLEKLSALARAGKVAVGKRRVRDISGRVTIVPCYRLVR